MGGLLKPRDKVLVVLKRDFDGRDVPATDEERASPPGSGAGRRAWEEVDSSSSGRRSPLSEAARTTKKGGDRLMFVASTRTLEAEVGLIKRSLADYNQRWGVQEVARREGTG